MGEFVTNPTFAVGLLAFVGSFAAIYVKNSIDKRDRAQAMAIMIRSEIQTILDLLKAGNYAEVVGRKLAELEAGAAGGISFRVTRSYTRIFEANLGDLGLLKSCVMDIVAFYAMVNSMLELKEQIELSPKEPQYRAQLLELHRSLLDKFQAIDQRGLSAIRSLQQIAH